MSQTPDSCLPEFEENTVTEPDNRTVEEKIVDMQANMKILNDSVKLLLKSEKSRAKQEMKTMSVVPELGNIDMTKLRIDEHSKLLADRIVQLLGRMIPNSSAIEREALVESFIILIKNESIAPLRSLFK